jgi:hypothetical protein
MKAGMFAGRARLKEPLGNAMADRCDAASSWRR